MRCFPEAHALEAIGITGFTLPTLYRWVRSDAGREATLHPYRQGHYLGSGKAEVVLARGRPRRRQPVRRHQEVLGRRGALEELTPVSSTSGPFSSASPIPRHQLALAQTFTRAMSWASGIDGSGPGRGYNIVAATRGGAAAARLTHNQ